MYDVYGFRRGSEEMAAFACIMAGRQMWKYLVVCHAHKGPGTRPEREMFWEVLATHNERVSITDTMLQAVIKFVYRLASENCVSLCFRPSVQST